MLRYHERITRQNLRDRPETLFVFGDNLRRAGLGGQAREMRGEPNAVGIPTKRAPAMTAGAFLSDSDLDEFRKAAAEPFARLAAHLSSGGDVVWPRDGIGTGRAELPARAPRIWAALERARIRLEAIAEAGRAIQPPREAPGDE